MFAIDAAFRIIEGGFMEQQKIKKRDVTYMLINILVPFVIFAVCILISVLVEDRNVMSGAMGVAMVALFGGILWLAIGTDLIYKKQAQKRLAELDAAGFTRNHTFTADGCTVVVDVARGNIAMIFKWNPFQYSMVPASRITRMWVDDGKTMGGTSRVSFLFVVDDVKVRVNTFTSNKVWSMKSNYVLEAISKADMMIESLKAAYNTAQARTQAGA